MSHPHSSRGCHLFAHSLLLFLLPVPVFLHAVVWQCMCLSVFGGGEHTRMSGSKRDETEPCGCKTSLLTGENGRKEGFGEER